MVDLVQTTSCNHTRPYFSLYPVCNHSLVYQASRVDIVPSVVSSSDSTAASFIVPFSDGHVQISPLTQY